MGPWGPSTPSDASSLFESPRPWWISGGWAIEAFTGVMRPHKDVDGTIFRRDLGALREHFRGRLDVWAAGSGTLRPLDDQRPRVRAGRRPVDDDDLAATLPLLEPSARTWLRAYLAASEPGHPWLRVLAHARRPMT